MRRSERRKRRSARRSARALKALAADRRAAEPSQVGAENQGSVTSAIVGITSGVAGIWRNTNAGSIRRRTTTSSHSENVAQDEETGHAASPSEEVEARSTGPRVTVVENAVERAEAPRGPQSVASGTPGSSSSTDSSTSRTPSLHAPGSIGSVLRYPATWLQIYMRKLRIAHEAAATKKAAERENLRLKVFAGATLANPGTTAVNDSIRRERRREQSRSGPRDAATGNAMDEGDGYGWGLGSFGLRAQQEGRQRLQEAHRQVREGRLLSRDDVEAGSIAEQLDASTATETGQSPSEEDPRANESEWVDANEERESPAPAPAAVKPAFSWSWWGPLREWRLADRSVF